MELESEEVREALTADVAVVEFLSSVEATVDQEVAGAAKSLSTHSALEEV